MLLFFCSGSAAPAVRRWRTRDWTPQEIGVAQGFVEQVHKGGWRQQELRRLLCEKSDRNVLRPLCAISRLVRKVLRCTHKPHSSPSLCAQRLSVGSLGPPGTVGDSEHARVTFYGDAASSAKRLPRCQISSARRP